MSRIYNSNGLLIQDISNDSLDCQNQFPYNGLGRYYSWPLDNKKDSLSIKLTTEAEDKWFNYYYGTSYNLAVAPSIEYVERYVDACKKEGIQYRILFIESVRNLPKWNEGKLDTRFLGFDYATSQEFFSALYDDLYGDSIPDILSPYKKILNSNGLFEKGDDLLSYVKDREHAINTGADLEPHGDFCMYRISLVISL